MLSRFVLLAAVAAAAALPAQETGRRDNDLGGDDCLRKDSAACMKYKLLSFVDKVLGSKDSFSVTDGVTLVRSAGASEPSGPRAFDDASILARARSFLETHSLHVELKGADVLNAATSVGRSFEETADALIGGDESDTAEGRGKKKKAAKILGPLMAAIALKAAALLPLLLGGIALIAGKALLIGKLALVLSAIIGLKKLLSQQKHVTYEVVAHPHHSSSHTSSHGSDYGGAGAGSSGYGGDGYSSGGGGGGGGGGHGGWGRAYDAQEQAYAAQKPQ